LSAKQRKYETGRKTTYQLEKYVSDVDVKNSSIRGRTNNEKGFKSEIDTSPETMKK